MFFIDHYKKVSTSDMNESMDNIYRLLKNLQDQLAEKDQQLENIKQELHQVDYEYFNINLKKSIVSCIHHI